MSDWLKDIFTGNITDPLPQNFFIYVVSYLLSILLSTAASFDALMPPGCENLSNHFLAITDCLLPTTVALTIGAIVQTIATALKKNISFRMPVLWSGVITFIYAWVYIKFRSQFWWMPLIAIIFTVIISVLNLRCVLSSEREATLDSINVSFTI